MHRFETPVPPRLTIDLRAGVVKVDTTDGTETTVDLQPCSPSTNALDVIAAATVEQRGDDIVVQVPRRHGLIIGRPVEIAVTITTPSGAGLLIETGSADVHARGRYSTASINSGSGDVELGVVTGSLRLRSGSGDVRVAVGPRRSGGADRFGRRPGRRACKAPGRCSPDPATSPSATAVRALRVKTGSGDITVGTAPDDLDVSTASGDIRIDAISRGEVSAKAASGDIRAGVRQGTAAWLDVRSIAGRVTSALERGDEPAAGEQQARLALETVSGDIELVRV